MSAADPILRFSLVDRWGATHNYMVELHRGGEGMDLVFELIQIGIGPAIESLRSMVEAAAGDTDDLEKVGLRVLAEADTGAIVTQVNTALATGKAPATMRKLFLRTTRDGQPLTDSANYDRAWQGNYAEPFMAARKIIEHNGFFELLSSLLASSSAEETTPTSSPTGTDSGSGEPASG